MSSPADHILIDSRSLVPSCASRTVFYALSTANNDGHRYIPELISKGVTHFVVSHLPSGIDTSGLTFTVVPSPLASLQALAAERRREMLGRVIAVTGSRGKTIVKEWLASMLAVAGVPVGKSPRSFNSQIGVPLALLGHADGILAGQNFESGAVIVEAGISQPGEMDRLRAIIDPDTVILTNVTSEHADHFSSRTGLIREKLSLASSARTLIIPADDPDIMAEAASLSRPEGAVTLLWSRVAASGADVRVLSSVTTARATRLSLSILGTVTEVDIDRFFDHTDIDNFLAALTALTTVIPLPLLIDRLPAMVASLHHLVTRLSVMPAVGRSKLIENHFTHDLPSLIPALDFMRRSAPRASSLCLILSACPDISRMILAAADYGVSHIIIIGEGASAIPVRPDLVIESFPSVPSFAVAFSPEAFSDSVILLAPAPTASFDEIKALLEAKQHETVLEVNLDAMLHNFNFFRSRLRPSTGIICMLKAAGYGAGSLELARALEVQGAAAIAVAVVDEGVELRRAGLTLPIIVLNPRATDLSVMLANNLEPEVYGFDMLEQIARAAARAGLADYPVHIKLETGMRRLGFTEDQLPMLVDRLAGLPSVAVSSVFSHLATADCPDMDDYTLAQLKLFDRCQRYLSLRLDSPFRRHILNSTGILRFPEYQYDLVRLGIGLYGIPTLDDGIQQAALRPISSLVSTVISLKHWKAGDSIGYARRTILSRDSVIATVPVGYADGVDRRLGNGNASMIVRGVPCPTVGNICMDICMIDVTDLPLCAVGDRVEIFGPSMPVTAIAETLGTIPYEVLTSVSSRVKRVYYRE